MDTITPCPEAAFSLCLKGTLNGIDAQLTIRGQSYAEFAANVAAVRGLLDPRASAQPPATNGSHQGDQPDIKGWCHVHNVHMKLQSNDRGSWYSHQIPEGWCRGKEKKSA